MNIHTTETRVRFREAVGKEIDRLISLLDDLDGDPDLEPAGDEKDHSTAGQDGVWQTSPSQHDDDEPNGDDEPSFGEGRYVNGKMEYDLEGDNSDDEPSLGWTTTGAFGLGNCEEENNGDETEPNGDEQDFSGYIDEGNWAISRFDGSGEVIAIDMLRKLWAKK